MKPLILALSVVLLSIAGGCAVIQSSKSAQAAAPATPSAYSPTPSFAEFDRKATAGQPMTVVFFGGSLTWGANASDPQRTSYRGLMADYLRHKYPRTSFAFYDAAIGGTGSKLGMFRLERDVMSRHPDLVFLDFTANDDHNGKDPETLSSYECLLRDMIGRNVAVVQAILPFKWNFGNSYAPEKMARYQEHLKLSAAYHTGLGDTFPYIQNQLTTGKANIDTLWAIDAVHPDDAGYQLFFEAVRDGFDAAVKEGRVCKVPAESVNAPRYAKRTRIEVADLPAPKGWTKSKTFRTSAFFDGLSSRWMDDVLVADAKNKTIDPLTVEFTGTFVALFGEGDTDGLSANIKIDGKPVQYRANWKTAPVDDWPFNTKRFGNKLFLFQEVSCYLQPGKHTIEIQPIVPATGGGQFRLSSVCAAGE